MRVFVCVLVTVCRSGIRRVSFLLSAYILFNYLQHDVEIRLANAQYNM